MDPEAVRLAAQLRWQDAQAAAVRAGLACGRCRRRRCHKLPLEECRVCGWRYCSRCATPVVGLCAEHHPDPAFELHIDPREGSAYRRRRRSVAAAAAAPLRQRGATAAASPVFHRHTTCPPAAALRAGARRASTTGGCVASPRSPAWTCAGGRRAHCKRCSRRRAPVRRRPCRSRRAGPVAGSSLGLAHLGS